MPTLKKGGVLLGAMLLAVVFSGPIQAADGPREVPFVEGKAPPEANPGEVWCLVTKPATYKTVTETVQIRPATWYYEKLPPVYDWAEEKIMVEPAKKTAVVVPAVYKTAMVKKEIRPASTQLKVIPAQYEWVEETVTVMPEQQVKSVVPAQYKTETKTVMTAPEKTVWKRVDCNDKKVKIDRRESSDECYYLVKIPAQYETVTIVKTAGETSEAASTLPAQTKTIKIQKLVKDAYTEKVVIPAEFQEIEQQVLVTPASVKYETTPAVYKTVKKQVLKSEGGQKKVEVPAKHASVTKQVLAAPAQLVWRKKGMKYKSVPGSIAK